MHYRSVKRWAGKNPNQSRDRGTLWVRSVRIVRGGQTLPDGRGSDGRIALQKGS